MDDKIDLLKNHLPEILVDNKRVYNILSLGIHELSEKACLAFFDVLKQGIILILEDEAKLRREAKKRASFAASVAAFQGPETST